MASGPQLGTLIHQALQEIDFSAADLPGELRAWLRLPLPIARSCSAAQPERLPRASLLRSPPRWVASLVDSRSPAWLERIALMSLRSKCPWRVVTTRLRGGFERRGRVARGVAARGRPGFRLRPAAADPILAAALRGYLNGSIDLVLGCAEFIPPTRETATRSSTTRPTGSGRPESRWPLPTTHRRCWGSRCSAPITCCRRCSTRSLCTAICAGGFPITTPRPIWPACVTCSCVGCWGRSSLISECSPGIRRVGWLWP